MKYCVEISEEQLRIISVAVDFRSTFRQQNVIK